MKKIASPSLLNFPWGPLPILKFKNVKKQLEAPFVVYADMESILRAYEDKNKVQEHACCSYAYIRE